MKPRLIQLGKHYPPEKGGMETHLYDQSSLLADRFDVSAVVANTEGRTVHDVVDGIPVTRVATMGTLFGNIVCPTYPLHVYRAQADESSIVHAHLPNPLAHVSYALVRPKGRLVVTWHSDIIKPRFVGPTYERLVERTLRRADRIIATSPNYIETSRALQRFKDRCVVIPLGIDVSRFEATDRVRQRAEAIQGEVGAPIVLFVGRLSYYKGLDVLLDAAARIQGRVVVVGDGGGRAALEEGIRNRGLEGRIILRHDVNDEDLVAYYHASEMLVLPSNLRTEAFGIVQLEAMACGKPVVSTRLDTGVPWVNQHERTGLTVPIDDAEALATAVNRLLDDSEARRRMGVNGRSRVEEMFTREVVAEKTRALFEEVLAAPASSLRR